MSMHVNRRLPVPAPPPPPVETPPPGPVDWWLLFFFLLLLCVGLLAVLSASGPESVKKYHTSYHFFKNQLIFMSIGGIIVTMLCWIPRSFINRLHYWGIGISIVLLALCPVIGKSIKGATRWIDLHFVMLQPMEFTRIALVLYVAYFLGTKKDMVKEIMRGLVPPSLITIIICFLLLLQPDYGGAAIMCMLVFSLFLAGGTKGLHLWVILLVLLIGGALLIVVEPYRLARFISFLDPFADRQGGGYQVVQGLLAMGTGGIFGVGLGGSVQKISHLPEAHNDFIMAVIGEETGFVGITFVICLFVAFFWRFYKVALGQPVLRDKLTAYGLTVAMALSFTMNFAVILSLMPPKGVAMPFISYGGSSLLSNMICAGLLLHYSRTARE